MKQTYRNILAFIFTAALTISLIQYMGYKLAPTDSNLGCEAVKAFHSLKKDSCDVIIYGSSHAWKGCDPRVIEAKYGLSAYNYGCNWQSLNTTLLFLEDSLRTQSPKVVCIEVWRVDSVLADRDMDGQIYYTRPIPYFDGKRDYLKQCFGKDPERYASYCFPLIMFHENRDQITEENFIKTDPKRFIAARGYDEHTEAVPAEKPDPSQFEQRALSDLSRETLDKIVDVCHRNNISIIFFLCPGSMEYHYGDAMKEYAEEKDCIYLDLLKSSDELDLDWENDLLDNGHLNRNGAAKVADYLGNTILSIYDKSSIKTGNML